MTDTQALADAINNLAEAIRKATDYDRLGHEICMGIRHGLFGNGDTSNNIADIFGGIEQPLERIADSADTISESVSELNTQGITTYEG